MTDYQVEERSRAKKHQVDQAIALAMQSKWEEAVSANRQILNSYPRDVDALNRLGRALTELSRYLEARDAYRRAVEIDPLNTIAQKNLSRLAAVRVEEPDAPARERVDPRLFIAETGKSGVTNLVRTARREILAKMGVGDQVYLAPEGRVLYVRNGRGETIGQVEPKLSQRLIDLLRGGNRYGAALMSLDDNTVRVMIRETYQDPSQSGKVSFPSRGEVNPIRPYIKGSLVKLDSDDDDDDDDDDDSEFGSDAEADSDDAADARDTSDFEDDSNN